MLAGITVARRQCLDCLADQARPDSPVGGQSPICMIIMQIQTPDSSDRLQSSNHAMAVVFRLPMATLPPASRTPVLM